MMLLKLEKLGKNLFVRTTMMFSLCDTVIARSTGLPNYVFPLNSLGAGSGLT